VIGADVVISNNTARYDGGGVYADGLEMSMVDAGNSSILLNTAQGLSGDTGYGGGLYLTAQTLSSYAYIGSGAPGFGAINLNHARYGGGVAVGGQSQNGSSKVAQLQLFSTQAGYPGSIQNNDASVAGGAIHLRSGNSGNITASAQLWNASLLNNSAPDGAAVMLTGSGAPISASTPASSIVTTPCPARSARTADASKQHHGRHRQRRRDPFDPQRQHRTGRLVRCRNDGAAPRRLRAQQHREEPHPRVRRQRHRRCGQRGARQQHRR
jgi:predicted outer membrane repeat protein